MALLAEIWEFTRVDLARLLRSGKGLVLLLLYGLVETAGGVVFAMLARSEAGQVLNSGVLQSFAAGADSDLAARLHQIPVPILFAYWFTLLVMPVLVLLMGFDQISGELSTRSVRYLAFRSRRVSFTLGKALAQVLALFGLSLCANVVVLLFTLFGGTVIPLGTAVFWLVVLWLLSVVYGLAYVALVAFVSSLSRVPFLSLVAGAVALVAMGITELLGRWYDAFHVVAYALPGTYSSGLVSPHPSTALGAIGALLAFTAVLLSAAVAVVRTRDL